MGSSDFGGMLVFGLIVAVLLIIAYYVFISIGLAKVFVKLGEQGWKAWIPFINTITVYELGGYTALWVIALLFPIVDFVALIILILAVNNVNRRLGYGGGMTFLAIFMYPIWAGIAGFGRRGDGGVILAKAPGKVKSDSLSTGSYPVLARQDTKTGHIAPPPPPAAEPVQQDPRVDVMDAQHSQTGEWEPIPAPTSVETQPAPGNQASRMVSPPPNVTGPVPPVPPPPVGGVVPPKESSPWAPTGDVSEAAVSVEKIEKAPEPAQPSHEWIPGISDEPAPANVAPEKVVAEEVIPVETVAEEVVPVEAVPAEAVAVFENSSIAVEEEIEATVISRRRQPKWMLSVGGADAVILEKKTVVIGRNPTSTLENVQLLSIKDSTKTVSKTHARLELDEETWTIWDLKSTNGVYLILADGQEQEISAGGSAPLSENFILGELPIRIFRDK